MQLLYYLTYDCSDLYQNAKPMPFYKYIIFIACCLNISKMLIWKIFPSYIKYKLYQLVQRNVYLFSFHIGKADKRPVFRGTYA